MLNDVCPTLVYTVAHFSSLPVKFRMSHYHVLLTKSVIPIKVLFTISSVLKFFRRKRYKFINNKSNTYLIRVRLSLSHSNS